ncbi:MAG: glycosyltransferase family 2 protein [Desulfovibrionaceae bacterium]|nr:glycosyltransferase family 2 protein [Desulfovibrionaceae bacterium]
MIEDKKIVLVMPAYNAEATLKKTFDEIPFEVVDEVLLVDDRSLDRTADLAREMGIRTFVHQENRGYGANQKTCYAKALDLGADIVVMLHPDYQYTPRLVTAMAEPIARGVFDCMLGSRILSGGALAGGMPVYKYAANRLLTLVQNILVRHKLSEYHTGYRAFSRQVLERVPFMANSDDFVFDNQMLCQIIHAGFRIGEITCPTRYDRESSCISAARSVVYGLGVLRTSLALVAHRRGWIKSPLFAGLDPGPD